MGIDCEDPASIRRSQYQTVQIITLCASFLSLVGSAITILSYLFFNKKVREGRPIYSLIFAKTIHALIFWLAITDFLLSLSIAASNLHLLAAYNAYPFEVCKGWLTSILFLINASFCWTSCIAFELSQQVTRKKLQVKRFAFYHLISWGIPFIIFLLVQTVDVFILDEEGWCVPVLYAKWIFWFVPLLASFFFNALCYALLMRKFYKAFGSNFPSRKELKHRLQRRLSLYLLAFLLCWIFDLIYYLVYSVNSKHCIIYGLWILPNLFSPLQGFFNFIIYGITHKVVAGLARPDTRPLLDRDEQANGPLPHYSTSLSGE